MLSTDAGGNDREGSIQSTRGGFRGPCFKTYVVLAQITASSGMKKALERTDRDWQKFLPPGDFCNAILAAKMGGTSAASGGKFRKGFLPVQRDTTIRLISQPPSLLLLPKSAKSRAR